MARLAVGRVVGAYANSGVLRVSWLGDGPEVLLGASTVWLALDEADEFPRRHGVEDAKPGAPGEVRLTLAGLRERVAADAWKGSLVLLDRSALEVLGEDEYYWFELVGFEVVDQEGARIGQVEELWATGAHDVLVVAADSGGQHLIPTAREFVTRIDREARRLEVAVIPGLLD